VGKFFVFLACALATLPLLSREVDSFEDEVRLKGYPEYVDENQRLENLRLSDVDEIKKAKAEWEKQKRDALNQYRREKASQAATVDESGPEYREYLEDKNAAVRTLSEARKNFVERRNRQRMEQRREVTVSEEEELKIPEPPPRVDWRKRKFFGGGAGSRPSFGGFSDGEAPPPPPPNLSGPGYFDSEAPPPPPPMPYDSGFDNEMPPPPPPPLFDEDGGF
jgi:hypothetical protein